ncbi:MAG: MBL fold metallo-hydrolase [Endomicrobiales bacterium]|nr:MBL fold metallo-hydrolase [Endomicrobiales bacterium]
MRIQLIAQGSTAEDRKTENWGVSFLVGKDTLFDTFGKPERFLANIKTFGVDVARLKNVVISHDDWDHTAGLGDILKLNNRADVIICPHTRQDVRDIITASGARAVESRELLEIGDGMYATGELSGAAGGRDVFEQALVVQSSRGFSLVTGCAHPGIVPMVELVKNRFGPEVYCVVGGLHMKGMEEGRIARVVSDLKRLGIKKVAPLHCTGEAAVRAMKEGFRDGFIELKEGKAAEV